MKRHKIYEPYYEAKAHTYHSADGTRLEGVTDILSGELGGYDGFPIEAALRGTDVHNAIQYYNEKDLDEDTLSLEVSDYLDCFKRAQKHHGIRVLQSEIMRYHPKYLYAGRCDAVVEIDGVVGVIDYKTGAPQRGKDRWQLAAYMELLKDEISNLKGRWNLYLKPKKYDNNCGFKLLPHTGPRDFSEFLALFAAYQIKRNNGFLKDKRS